MKLFIKIIIFLLPFSTYAQSITISGYITDELTGEKLIGVTCYDTISKQSVFSNTYGFFSFTSSNPTIYMKYSYVGYASYNSPYSRSSSQVIKLKSGIELSSVQVYGDSFADKEGVKLSTQSIKNIPGILGETDLMRSLTFLPGVMGGSEGSTGIYVRGSSPDQNLVLWDEAVLYNLNHLGGFFSIFNPTIVKDVELFNSYIPSSYGGRASSVLAVTTRQGNNRQFEGQADVGLINQNLTIEGPIKKNSSSFILAGRYSNLGLFTRLAKAIEPNDYAKIDFYDFSGRISSKVGTKGLIDFSFFNGSDAYTNQSNSFGISKRDELKWSNTAYSLRYLLPISQKVFARFILTQTRYNSKTVVYENNTEQNTKQEYVVNNRIIDNVLKAKVDYFPINKLHISVGSDLTFHNFNPSYSNTGGIEFERLENKEIKTIETGSFLLADFNLTKRLKLQSGVRYSSLFDNNSQFSNWEPRSSLLWKINQKSSLRLSYSKMSQYVHSLSNTGAGFNVEVWVPANEKVRPLSATTLALGYRKSFFENSLKFSSEVYVKNLNSLITYAEGTNFTIFQTDDWVNKVAKNGLGRSYGWENNVTIDREKLHLNLSYTLSKSERRFADINNADWYPFKFDRRHYLTATGSYQLNSKWLVSSSFIFQTGQAYTLPSGVTFKDAENLQNPRLIYSSFNNGRFPIYHRMDIGFTKTYTTKHKREATFSFGAVNLYNRKNPAYLDVRLNNEAGQLPTFSTVSKAILPVLPFVKWGIKF